MQSVQVNEIEIPSLGLGTYTMKGTECREACRQALELGYRHIDTAQMYDNEGEVGAAISRSEVPREKIFVVTKLLRENLTYENVHSSIDESLTRLGLDYVDMLLIHAPSRRVPIEETIGAMNELQEEGAVEHIGVSNFSISQTEDAVVASETPIITNQVKYNPFKSQKDLLQFCIDESIMLTAHTPLARTRISENSKLQQIGSRHNKTTYQIALRWLLQQQMVSTIPKSSDPDHLQENIDIFDFELSDEEMEEIFTLS